MRGMVRWWCPAGTGVAEPRAVDGVARERPGGGGGAGNPVTRSPHAARVPRARRASLPERRAPQSPANKVAPQPSAQQVARRRLRRLRAAARVPRRCARRSRARGGAARD